MRVLLVNTSDAGGGAQEVGGRLLRELRARGHEAELAVGHRVGDEQAVTVLPNAARRPAAARAAAVAGSLIAARGAPRLGRAVERVGEPGRWARAHLGYEDFDFPGTWTLLDGTPPDVIHLHNLHGGYFDLRALPALSRRAPLIVTLHDGWMLSGHCAHSFACERWRSGCGACPHLHTYPALERDRTAANWARKRSIYSQTALHAVAPCKWMAGRADASILRPVETHVIPNGVDLDTFRPDDRAAARAQLGLPQDADVVLFAANSTRSNDFKDFPTLERVLELLGGRDASRPLLLVSVGEAGPERTVGSAHLQMVGHVGAPSALVPWYRAADLYLHPARADTFPTTVLEALACGLPVVASAVGGIPEQVVAGVTGALVPVGDAPALAEAVAMLLDAPERRAAASLAARADAERRFGATRMVDDYVALYERLRAGRNRPAARRSDSSPSS